MANEIETRQQNSVQRDIGTVTAEIKGLIGQAQRVATVYAVEIGRRLAEAKSLLAHGEWGQWLKEEISFSERTAQNFMTLFEEYGDQQLSIFDAITNTKSIADLPYTKALALLSVPADEREEFAEEVHADELSVRELKEAIRAREDAERSLGEVEKDRDELNARVNEAQKEIDKLKLQVEFGVQESKSISQSLKDAKMQKAAAEQALEQARKDKEAAEKALKEALEHPQLTDEQKDALIADAAEDAAAQATKAAQKRIDELRIELEKAQEAAEQAKKTADEADAKISEVTERANEAEKKLRTANPDVAAFKALFDSLQKTVIDMQARIERIREASPETADKLAAAMHALGQRL